MNLLSVSNDGQTIRPDVRRFLLAYAFFPDAPHDAELFLEILKSEIERRKISQNEFKSGRVFNAVQANLNKRSGQGAIAGLVALSYLFLKSKGLTASFEKSSALTSEAAYISGKGKIRGSYRPFALSGDPADIKAIFREYRSTAHIWATELCYPRATEQDASEDVGMHECNSHSRTVLYFQEALEGAAKTKNWNMMSVREGFPRSALTFSSWEPHPDLAGLLHQAFDFLVEKGAVFPRA